MNRRLFTTLAVLLLLLFVALLIRFAVRRQAAGNLMTGPISAPDLEAILADQRAYLTAEGPARRGPRFEQLALKLSTQIHAHGKRLGRSELFDILGDPDLESGMKVDPSLGSVRAYAYFYDRFAHRDWVVYAMVDDAGHVTHLGFNAASAADHSSWRPFTSTTTRPATTAP